VSLSPIAGTRAITIAPEDRPDFLLEAGDSHEQFDARVHRASSADGRADARIVGTERIGGHRP
jgi:hypothetical protein